MSDFASAVLRLSVLIGCLVAPSLGWTQYDSDRGQWQILAARYGTAERNVDVTQRLRELAREDATFQVTNRLFGGDPYPGVVKALRIYARGPGGATRTFEYHENDYVDGNAFTGWAGGNWGQGGWAGGWGGPAPDPVADRGQWQILEARYGTAQRNVDVTQRLRDVAREDVAFQVTNNLFGGDPYPGVVKTLRIYARGPGGAVRTFEYGENQWVDGAMFTAWSSGNWGNGGWKGGWGHEGGGGPPPGGLTIVSAQYGEGPNRRDVTARLRSMVRDGRISIRVTNDEMGSDPAPGRVKTLWVTYEVGGHGQQQVRVPESGVLALP